MKWLALAFVLVASSLLYTSCKREDFENSVAVVTYSGDFVDGGCGWVLQFGAQLYQGQNLPDSYKQEGLIVNVTYKLLKESPDCLNLPEVKGILYIHKIEIVQ